MFCKATLPWDVNSSPSNKTLAGLACTRFGLVQFFPPFAAAVGAASQGSPREDAWDVQGCPGDVLHSWGGCAAPESAAVLLRPAEGSWGLAESASCRRMRAEKEKQRREVVCRELYAEIISVWMSRLGFDAAVGDWATFPDRGKSHVSVAVDPGLAALVSAGMVQHYCSWRVHPTCGSALPTALRPGALQGGAPKPSPGGCTHHCGLPRLQWVPWTPQLGYCCGYQCVNLLCEPGVPEQGWGSQHPFYQPGAAGCAFLGSP